MTSHRVLSSRPSYELPKRLIDIVLASLLLSLSAPLQAALAILIAGKLGRPVFFRQLRPGRESEPFTLIKFRSMHATDHDAGRVTDADRLTSFGGWLRRTSLDEIPTLWNVVRGDMSLVGPRPLLMQYLPRYSPHQARRHEVRPGITGLAQVCGRNYLAWEDKFDKDVEYVDSRCLRLDLRILRDTVGAVISGDGISAADHATMAEFLGATATETNRR